LTNRLEKPFNAYFGGDLNSFLFGLSEFYDEQTIEDEVRTVIENYEPRARLRGVRAKIIPDENDIRVTVAFQVVSTQEEITLEVSLARLR
jgi:predicted component of type VI protein secretion system